MFAIRARALRPLIVFVFAAFFVAGAGDSAAQPSISGVDGTFVHGAVVSNRGSGFGVKSPARPAVWADFEDGLQPTALGRVTTWSVVSGMSRATDTPSETPGTGFAASSNNSGTWTLRIDADGTNLPFWNANGQKVYVYRLLKKNYTIYNTTSNNIKYWRMWEPTTNYPNIYWGRDRAYVEGSATETGFWAHGGLDWNTSPNAWSAQEIVYQASSGIGMKDGTLALIFDGRNRTSAADTIMTRPADNPGFMTQHYPIHEVIANKSSWSPAWADSYRMWVDEVYVDTTWARVMLGDASTLAGCTKLSPQIPSSWTDTSVTVTVNVGLLWRAGGGYLYVIDALGRVNSTGFFVSSSSDRAPARPTGVVVR